MKKRCQWANSSELEKDYHDYEWGKPVHEEKALFESLSLELLQSGLSWSIILKKRETLRKGFSDWDVSEICLFDQKKVEELLNNEGVIRHRKKIKAIINNAGSFQKIQQKYGSFDTYIWSFVEGPIKTSIQSEKERVSQTILSKQISEDLKKQGFQFLGSITVYSFMQAIGLVNAHEEGCFLQ